MVSMGTPEAVEITENMAESWREEERGHFLVARSEGAPREADLAAIRVGIEGYHLRHQP